MNFAIVTNHVPAHTNTHTEETNMQPVSSHSCKAFKVVLVTNNITVQDILQTFTNTWVGLNDGPLFTSKS